MSTKIVCTVIDRYDIDLLLEVISLKYNVINNHVYIFEDINFKDTLYCTYKLKKPFDLLSNSFIVHRNDETNTLYTLNALNHIIKLCNNGKLVKFYQVDWKLYENKLLQLNNNRLQKKELNLIDVKKLEKKL